MAHWRNVYAGTPCPLMMPPCITLDKAALRRELQNLPARKALPAHYAPALCWKLMAQPLLDLLERTLLHDWSTIQVIIPQEWKDGWLVLLAKPGKSAAEPAHYRPIALSSPIGKCILGVAMQALRPQVQRVMMSYPQYAYLPHRSTRHALSRAFAHCRRVKDLLDSQKRTLRERLEGKPKRKLVGGLTLALDLQGAFDNVTPSHLEAAVQEAQVPHDLSALLLAWHQARYYHINHQGQHSSIPAVNGVRQGCRAAPLLWILFTRLFMQQLQPRLSHDWCMQHLTLFADDMLSQHVFEAEEDITSALEALGHLLNVLTKLGMRLSEGKSYALFQLAGSRAKTLNKRFLKREKSKTYLRIPSNPPVMIEVVQQVDYLGCVLSYGNFARCTVTKRLQAAHKAYQRLKSTLHCKTLTLLQRVRMWRACVRSTALYGLVACPLPASEGQRLHAALIRQLRSISRSPVHLTGESNARLYHRLKVADPLKELHSLAGKALENIDSPPSGVPPNDISLDPLLREWCRKVHEAYAVLTREAAAATQEKARVELPCGECNYTASSLKALRLHRRKAHGYDKISRDHRPWKQVDRLKYGVNGLPTCSLCGHAFQAWQQLQAHIHLKSCLVLQGNRTLATNPTAETLRRSPHAAARMCRSPHSQCCLSRQKWRRCSPHETNAS